MSRSTYKLEYGRNVARLRRRVVVISVRPRAIPLAMIAMRKSIQEFPFLSYNIKPKNGASVPDC